MAEDRNYTGTTDRTLQRGASEKPLGPQVSMEAQKASRQVTTNEQQPAGGNSGANPNTEAGGPNQGS